MLQQSGFTLHGGKWGTLEINPAEELPRPLTLEELSDHLEAKHPSEGFLCEVTIKNKRAIRDDLALMGIHGGSLFPELEYQSTFIKDIWSYKNIPVGQP